MLASPTSSIMTTAALHPCSAYPSQRAGLPVGAPAAAASPYAGNKKRKHSSQSLRDECDPSSDPAAPAAGQGQGQTHSMTSRTNNSAATKHTALPPAPPSALPQAPAPANAEEKNNSSAAAAAAATATQERSSKRTKRPADSTAIADWFAKMICYIWFAPAQPNISSRPVTPSQSPLAGHAALQQSSASASSVPQGSPFLAGTNLGGASNYDEARRSRAGSLSQLPSAQQQQQGSASLADVNARFAAELRRRGLQTADGAQHAFTTSSASASASHLLSSGQRYISSMLRLKPQAKFTTFAREVLATTQLSNSVILLALLYIYRFKTMHPEVKGQDGSEYRLAVVGLMLANKFLDDNTYTNKTWSDISDIRLRDITRMEIEFWSGLEMRIHVSEHEFIAWKKQLEAMTEQRSRSLMRRERELMTGKGVMARQPLQQQSGHVLPVHNKPMGPAAASIANIPPQHASDSSAQQQTTTSWAFSPFRTTLPTPASLHSSPLRPRTADRPLAPFTTTDLFNAPSRFPPHTAWQTTPTYDVPAAVQQPAAPAYGVTSAISPSSATTVDASSSTFGWSTAGSPVASSRTSVVSNGMRYSMSPMNGEADAVAPVTTAEQVRRSSSSVISDLSTIYGKRPYPSAAFETEPALYGSFPASPTSAVSSKRRFAPAFSQAQQASRRVSLQGPIYSPATSSYPSGPRHGYDLRSRVKKSTSRPVSSLAPSAYTATPIPQSQPMSLSRSSGISDGFGGAQPLTLSQLGFTHSNHPSHGGAPFHSLFSDRDAEKPDTLVAPFQASHCHEHRPLSYYQLASGVPKGIPAYHVPGYAFAAPPSSAVWSNAAYAAPSEQAVLQQAGPSAARMQPTRSGNHWQPQEPFNNAQHQGDDQWPLHFAGVARRSPSQIM